jgi:hypothetical protein
MEDTICLDPPGTGGDLPGSGGKDRTAKIEKYLKLMENCENVIIVKFSSPPIEDRGNSFLTSAQGEDGSRGERPALWFKRLFRRPR